MLTRGETYAPSMAKFLNKFAKEMQEESEEKVKFLGTILSSFLDMCSSFSCRDLRYFFKKSKHFRIRVGIFGRL